MTPLDNKALAIMWSTRTNGCATSVDLSMSYNGRSIFSFGKTVGRFVQGKNGQFIALVTSDPSENTLKARHLPVVWNAIHYGYGAETSFTVPILGQIGKEPTENEHKANLAHLVARFADRYAKYALGWALSDTTDPRCQQLLAATEGTELLDMAHEAFQYAETFGLPDPELHPSTPSALEAFGE